MRIHEKFFAADIHHVTNLQKIMSLGVMSLPGVVINGNVVSCGKKLSKAELEKLLDNAS
ncbi:MAG: thioredoxin family protein [Spirochaetia bacterium]|nr:thioredoxin family protein [Spirochaetia bacterium]